MVKTLEDIVEVCRKRYRKSLETGNKELQEEQRKLLEAMTFQLLNIRAKKIQKEFYSTFSLGIRKQ